MKENFEFFIKIGTAVCGLILFWKGLKEYRNNLKIKRAEFLDKLIKEFLNNEIDLARDMLDDYHLWSETPIEQEENPKPLAVFLRDHKVLGIKSEEERAVRKSFDKLLDFFSQLSYYLKQDLISPAELSYFRYYLQKIQTKPEVIFYIKRYFYISDFDRLFEAYQINFTEK